MSIYLKKLRTSSACMWYLLLAALVLLLFPSSISGLVVDLNASNPLFVVSDATYAASRTLELHVCRNLSTAAAACDPSLTNISVLLNNVLFTQPVLVTVFGYAPTGQLTTTTTNIPASATGGSGATTLTTPAGYEIGDVCPYRSLSLVIRTPRASSEATTVFNGSFCNANFSNIGGGATNATDGSGAFDIILYNLVLSRSAVIMSGLTLGLVAAFGQWFVLCAASIVDVLASDVRGTPWNATLDTLLRADASLRSTSLLMYGTSAGSDGSGAKTTSPSLWLELQHGLVITDSSRFRVGPSTNSSSLRRGAVVVAGDAWELSPPPSAPPDAPLLLLAHSSALIFEQTTIGSFDDMVSGAVLIGAAHRLVAAASSGVLGVPNRNASVHLIAMNNSTVTVLACTISTLAPAASSSLLFIPVAPVELYFEQSNMSEQPPGLMLLLNGSTITLNSSVAQSLVATALSIAAVVIRAANTYAMRMLWMNSSGLQVLRRTNVTSNNSMGIAIDASGTTGFVSALSESSFLRVADGSQVTGATAGIAVVLVGAQHAAVRVTTSSSIGVEDAATLVAGGGGASTVEGGVGLHVICKESRNVTFVIASNSFVGAQSSGRLRGTSSALLVDASSAFSFVLTVSGQSVLGARDCGVLEVVINLPLQATPSSTLSLRLDNATASAVNVLSESVLGLVGSIGGGSNCQSTSSISGSGLSLPAALPADDITSASYTLAAIDVTALLSLSLRVAIDDRSTVGVVMSAPASVDDIGGVVVATLGNIPNASIVGINLDGSRGATFVVSAYSYIGVITLTPTVPLSFAAAAVVSRGPCVVLSAVQGTGTAISLTGNSSLGVVDASVSSTDGRVTLVNLAKSTNCSVRVGEDSGARDASMLGVRLSAEGSCALGNSSDPTSALKKILNITAGTAQSVVQMTLSNATGAQLGARGPGAYLGVLSTDCIPFAASSSSVIKAASLVRVDGTSCTNCSVAITAGGLLGISLGLQGQQGLQLTNEWLSLNFIESVDALLVTDGVGSMLGTKETVFRSTLLSGKYGTAMTTLTAQLATRFTSIVSNGAVFGVSNVAAPDAVLPNSALGLVRADFLQSNASTIICTGAGSLIGVASSNVSFSGVVATNSIYFTSQWSTDLSLQVRSFGMLGLVDTSSRALGHVHLRWSNSTRTSVAVDGTGSRLGAVRSFLGPYGSTAFYCQSCVNFTMTVTNESAVGILDGTIVAASVPGQYSSFGAYFDISSGVGASVVVARGSCIGFYNATEIPKGTYLAFAFGVTLSGSTGTTVTIDDNSVLGLRGGVSVTISTLFRLESFVPSDDALVIVSRNSVLGVAEDCVFVGAGTGGAVVIAPNSSRSFTLLVSEGSVVGAAHNVSMVTAGGGITMELDGDEDTTLLLTGASVFGVFNGSFINSTWAGNPVSATCASSLRPMFVLKDVSVFGAARNSTIVAGVVDAAIFLNLGTGTRNAIVMIANSSVFGAASGSVVWNSVRMDVSSLASNTSLRLEDRSVFGATSNSTIVGVRSLSVYMFLLLTTSVTIQLRNRSVIGVSEGGIVTSTSSNTNGVTLYASSAKDFNLSIVGASSIGVLPECPFGPSLTNSLLENCLTRAQQFRRAYITTLPLVRIAASNTDGVNLIISDRSLLGIASLPWPQLNGAGDGIDRCARSTDTSPCPLIAVSGYYHVILDGAGSNNMTVRVEGGSCVGVCVEARTASTDVSDILLRSYFAQQNVGNYNLRWVVLQFAQSRGATIILENGSTVGVRSENSFQDPAGTFVCSDAPVVYHAAVFLTVFGVSSVNMTIRITQDSRFGVAHRADVIVFNSALSRLVMNMTDALGLHVTVTDRSAFAETLLVVPQIPKTFTWPSPGCNASRRLEPTFAYTGLYGLSSSTKFYPHHASVNYVQLRHVLSATFVVGNNSYVSRLYGSTEGYVSNPTYHRFLSASLGTATFVTQGCPLVLDLSGSENLSMQVTSSLSLTFPQPEMSGSSVVAIQGSIVRTISENDSGGILLLATATRNLTITLTTAYDTSSAAIAVNPPLLAPSAVMLIAGGASVLRNRSNFALVSLLFCTDPYAEDASSTCTASGARVTASGAGTAVVWICSVGTNLAGQMTPSHSSTFTSTVLNVPLTTAGNASTVVPAVLILLPPAIAGTTTTTDLWMMNLGSGASLLRISHGANVSGDAANATVEPMSLAVGIFTANSGGGNRIGEQVVTRSPNIVLNASSNASLSCLIDVSSYATMYGRVRISACSRDSGTFPVAVALDGDHSAEGGAPGAWIVRILSSTIHMSMLSSDVASSTPFDNNRVQTWELPNATLVELAENVEERRSLLSVHVAVTTTQGTSAFLHAAIGSVYLKQISVVDLGTVRNVSQFPASSSTASAASAAIANYTQGMASHVTLTTPALVWWPELDTALRGNASTFALPPNTTVALTTSCLIYDKQELRVYSPTSALLDTTARGGGDGSGVVGYLPIPMDAAIMMNSTLELVWDRIACSKTQSLTIRDTSVSRSAALNTSTVSLPKSLTMSEVLSNKSDTTSLTFSPSMMRSETHSLTPLVTPTATYTRTPTHSGAAPTHSTPVGTTTYSSTHAQLPTPSVSRSITSSTTSSGGEQTLSSSRSPSGSLRVTRSESRRTPSHSQSGFRASRTGPSWMLTSTGSIELLATGTNATSATTTLQVPPRPLPPKVPEAVAGVVKGSTAVTALISPAGALGAGRLSLMMALGACDDVDGLPDVDSVLSEPLDMTSSPTQLLFGPSYGATHRGAVVGNVVICVGAIVLGFILTLLVRALTLRGGSSAASRTATSSHAANHSGERHHDDRHAGTIVEHAASLRLPGLLFIVVALFYQQVIVSSVLLLVYPHTAGPASWEATDRAIGACGLLISLAIILSMGRVLDPRADAFRAVAADVDENELTELRAHLFPRSRRRGRRHHDTTASCLISVRNRFLYAAAWLQAEKVCWSARHGGGDALFVERYGFLFEGCDRRRHWWVVLEMLGTIILSALSAFVPETVAACLAASWSSISVSFVQLLLTVFLRPMNSVLENSIVIGLAAVQLAVGLCTALAAPPMVSFALSALATMLSALLALATLTHIVRTRLRGISTLLRAQRRQFLPLPKRVDPVVVKDNEGRHMLLDGSSGGFLAFPQPQQHYDSPGVGGRSRALRHVVLPPIEVLDLPSVVNIICVGIQEEEERRRRRGVGEIVPVGHKLSVVFAKRPDDRPRRKIIIPDLPDELAVNLNDLFLAQQHQHDDADATDLLNNGDDYDRDGIESAISFRST